MALLCLLLAACDGKEPAAPDTAPDTAADAYILNEGSWGGNNASLSLLRTADGHIQNGYFAARNGCGLGDVAQDIILYGSKIYVAVTESKTLWVLNPATGLAIRRLSLAAKPRSFAAAGGSLYLSCYDKTVLRIDTATLTVTATCHLSGLQPEQMAAAGSRLYVANSWQQTANGDFLYDSTLSVVDLATFREIGKITVGHDPTRLKALGDGRIAVLYGNGYNTPCGALLLSPAPDPAATILTPLPVALNNMETSGGDIYGYTSAYDDDDGHQSCTFYRIDGTTLQATKILGAYLSDLQDAYGLSIDPRGNLYVFTGAYNAASDVLCFDSTLTKRWRAEAGIYASKAIFLKE